MNPMYKLLKGDVQGSPKGKKYDPHGKGNQAPYHAPIVMLETRESSHFWHLSGQ